MTMGEADARQASSRPRNIGASETKCDCCAESTIAKSWEHRQLWITPSHTASGHMTVDVEVSQQMPLRTSFLNSLTLTLAMLRGHQHFWNTFPLFPCLLPLSHSHPSAAPLPFPFPSSDFTLPIADKTQTANFKIFLSDWQKFKRLIISNAGIDARKRKIILHLGNRNLGMSF